MTAAALAELVKAREVSAGELLEAAVARVEQNNPTINAVVNRMYDQAKAAIAAGFALGSIHRVPYLLKDIGSLYAGTVTTLGSSAFRNIL
jgi:amidase